MKSFPGWLKAVLAVAVLALLAGGVSFYRVQERHVSRDVEANLQSIAELKAKQIAAWRIERLADVNVFIKSPFFNEAVGQWLESPDPRKTEKLLARFRISQKYYHYHDVLLVDGNGRVLLSLSGKRDSLHKEAMQTLAAAAARNDRRAVLTDLHTEPRRPATPFGCRCAALCERRRHRQTAGSGRP